MLSRQVREDDTGLADSADSADFTNLPPGRILVVDDEPIIRFSLADILLQNGYYVDEAHAGDEAERLLSQAIYDVMILDIQIPGKDGLEVLKGISRLSNPPYVIILTGHASLESAITAIRTEKVVDYLCKPVSAAELLERVDYAIKKRAQRIYQRQLAEMAKLRLASTSKSKQLPDTPAIPPAPSRRFICVDAFTLDRERRLMLIEATTVQKVPLTRGETEIMSVLMSMPYRVLSCIELARYAWGYELDPFDAASLVRPHIFRLRQKLEPNPKHPVLIRTVRQRGYTFVPDPGHR